jgi:hypothetical protein
VVALAAGHEVDWDKVTSAEVRDYVLWLSQALKPRNSFRTASVLTAGTVNPITRKQYLNDRYQARTVRHSNAVLRSFYDFWIDLGGGPLINPVRRHRTKERRPHEHHNPLDPYRSQGRILYNPKIAKRRPRDMPDDRWKDLFAALGIEQGPSDPRVDHLQRGTRRRGPRGPRCRSGLGRTACPGDPQRLRRAAVAASQ